MATASLAWLGGAYGTERDDDGHLLLLQNLWDAILIATYHQQARHGSAAMTAISHRGHSSTQWEKLVRSNDFPSTESFR